MKRITLAASLVVLATSAYAQDTKPAPAPVIDIPKPKCEPKPVFPGTGGTERVAEGRRRVFDRDMATYKTCMNAYMEEQKARTLAHQAAYKSSVDEYNATMKEINAQIEAGRQQNEAGSK
jgi:hypothetical protein